MKRGILICMALVAMMVARADGKHTLLPGKGHIDVEKLNKTIDLNMDISQLSVSELRVLRNAFAARQGYLFMSSDLRGIFSATSWYDKVMNKRFWAEEGYDEEGNTLTQKPAPISYTKEEQAFIARLKAREDELKQQNFQTSGGNIVNVTNLVNPFQLNEQNPRLMETLGRNGFAIVPANNEQMFHVYERNDYHEFPSFVTTDLYLQAFHMYFDCVLREVEQQKFIPTLTNFTQKLYEEMNRLADTTPNADMKAAAQYDAAFFAIGHALLTGEPLVKLKHPTMAAPSGKGTLNLQQQAEQEIKHVMAEEYAYSDFLEYTEEMRMPMFTYPMFRPRGHYTRNETLKHYFRGMMWLQSVPFAADIDHQLKRALVMAQVIGSNPALTKTYQSVAEPLDYLMGMPDNVTILQVYAEITKTGASLGDVLKNKKLMSQIRSKIEELALKQTRIVPKFLRTSRYKINLMPQRYMPDGEVLQEMVDYDNEPTLRDAPKGLDVLAAIGISSAERLLLKELNEQGRWDKYTENLNRMKQRMTEIDWQASVANQWIHSLRALPISGSNPPYFMKTVQWDKKCLNTALASWAELKHDAILYAKQPFGAECGGGGIPEPTTKGYVEPNVNYWQVAISLIDDTKALLEKYHLVTDKIEGATESLRDKAEFLLGISEKEIEGRALTNEEYDQINYIGAAFENITLDLVCEPDQWLAGWSDVQGADKSIAVVADVYTANAGNNPDKSVLYEAVGPAHEMYVVVEIDGYLWLTRGAVFSYREFQEDLMAPRLTDEEWQEQLQGQPNKGIPTWMEELIVPMDNKELDNEYIFYSSGC